MVPSTTPASLHFSLARTLEVLERTPAVLHALLHGLSDDWTEHNEGPGTWTPSEVVGHLIHGERAHWMARVQRCLSADDKAFAPFDRQAHLEESAGKSLPQLLAEFEALRKRNLAALVALEITGAQLEDIGLHPGLGEVRLREVLAAWAAHDLAHIGQISRVLARQYREAVGPWRANLRVMG